MRSFYLKFYYGILLNCLYMPIEDLDYLYKNSVKENIIVLVDSAKRDHLFWKSPNDFRIDFDEPFKYVYGVDILDISVPRTMYSVDTYNNELYIKYGHILNGTVDDLQDISIRFIKRDYTVKELVEEMSVETSPLFTKNIAVSIEDDVAIDERKSIIVYTNVDTPPKPFIFDMHKSTMNEALGFDEIAQTIFPEKYRKVYNNDNNYLFASVPVFQTDGEGLIRHPTFEISNNVFELKNMINDDINDNINDDINGGTIATHLNDTSYKYQSYHIKGITLDDISINDDYCDFFVYKFDYSETGFTDSNTKQTVISNFRLVIGGIDKMDVQEIAGQLGGNIELVAKNQFKQIGSNLVFDLDESDKNPYYFKYIPITVRGDIFYLLYIDSIDLSYHIVSSSVSIDIVDGFQLTSPGLVQLSGDRYITVHCDEIENHLRGSMMYNTYSPGLAMINLGVQGFSESRNDFFGVKYKEFHPIGKLTGMRFCLKTAQGLLYDLKNVNWHMLLSIKYYVPKKTDVFEHSSLNPNYNYNYIQYQIDKANNELEFHNKEDDPDEDEFKNKFMRKEIALKEDYYDNSDDSYDESSSSDENI